MREDEDGVGAEFTLVSPPSRRLRNHSKANTAPHMENIFLFFLFLLARVFHNGDVASSQNILGVLFYYYILKKAAQSGASKAEN